MRFFLFLILLLSTPWAVHASYLKIGASLGMGSFSAQKDDLQRSEGPFAFGVSLDYDINSRWSLGAEHLRSLTMSPMGTSVAMTGFTGRWYYLTPVPNALRFDEPFIRARILQQGFFPYFGWSFGFAQASILGAPDEKNLAALDIALAAKAGMDYPLQGDLAVRTELNIGLPIFGTGSISYYALTVGGILFW